MILNDLAADGGVIVNVKTPASVFFFVEVVFSRSKITLFD